MHLHAHLISHWTLLDLLVWPVYGIWKDLQCTSADLLQLSPQFTGNQVHCLGDTPSRGGWMQVPYAPCCWSVGSGYELWRPKSKCQQNPQAEFYLAIWLLAFKMQWHTASKKGPMGSWSYLVRCSGSSLKNSSLVTTGTFASSVPVTAKAWTAQRSIKVMEKSCCLICLWAQPQWLPMSTWSGSKTVEILSLTVFESWFWMVLIYSSLFVQYLLGSPPLHSLGHLGPCQLRSSVWIDEIKKLDITGPEANKQTCPSKRILLNSRLIWNSQVLTYIWGFHKWGYP